MTQHAVTFDTLAFVKKIESSGLEAKHAESIAEAMRDVFEENLSDTIFTKEDGRALKYELKADISEFKSELKEEVSKLKSDISEFKSELKEEVSELKSELKEEISESKANMFKLKSEMIMWVIGLLFAQTAVMVSIIKFLH